VRKRPSGGKQTNKRRVGTTESDGGTCAEKGKSGSLEAVAYGKLWIGSTDNIKYTGFLANNESEISGECRINGITGQAPRFRVAFLQIRAKRAWQT